MVKSRHQEACVVGSCRPVRARKLLHRKKRMLRCRNHKSIDFQDASRPAASVAGVGMPFCVPLRQPWLDCGTKVVARRDVGDGDKKEMEDEENEAGTEA